MLYMLWGFRPRVVQERDRRYRGARYGTRDLTRADLLCWPLMWAPYVEFLVLTSNVDLLR